MRTMKRKLFIGFGVASLVVATVVATLGGPRGSQPSELVRPELAFQERLKQLSRENEWKEAHEWYMVDKLYPDFKISASHYEEAARVMERLEPARERGPGRGRRLPIGDWEYVGPKNMDTALRLWAGPSPVSGRLNSMVWDVNDENTMIVTARGGIFRTNDRGLNWHALNNGWGSAMSSAVAVHPNNPARLWAGTGDYVGESVYYGGIMRTTNTPGFWWQVQPAAAGEGPVSDVVIHPDNPDILLATSGKEGKDGRVRRTADGGDTWQAPHQDGQPLVALPTGDWCDLDFSIPDGRGQRLIYATRSVFQGGAEVWVSKNNGVSFKKTSLGSTNGAKKSVVAASQVDPLRAYVLVSEGRRIWRTDDGGDTWIDITGDFKDEWFKQMNYNFCIESVRIAASESEALVVGQSGLFLCKNPEASSDWEWTDLGLTHVEGPVGATYNGSPARLHCDFHVLVSNPHRPNQLFVGSDGGAFLMTLNASGDPTVEMIGGGLPTTMFYHAAFHPTHPDVMIGGLQDNSTASTSTQGAWGDLNHWGAVNFGDGGYAAINPANPMVQYSSHQYGQIYRTSNAWADWDPDVRPGYIGKAPGASYMFIAPMELDRNNPDHLYVAGGYAVHRWNNATGTWTGTVVKVPTSAEYIRSLHIPLGSTNRIYIGTWGGKLFVGDTQSGAVKDLTKPITPKRAITDIHIHPSDLNTMLVTFGGVGGGHLYRVTLTGTSVGSTDAAWEYRDGSGGSVLPDIPANSVERDPAYPQTTWYVGTDVGVLMTTDAGATWKNATQILGMPGVEVRHLEYVPGTGYLNCATYGRGIFRLRLAPAMLIGFFVGLGESSAVGGREVGVRLDLSEAAPAGGATILLGAFGKNRTGDWEPTSLMTLPTSVTIPEGQTSAQFSVPTMPVWTAERLRLEARLGVELMQVDFDLLPPTFSVRIQPFDMLGGATAEGRIDLENPAPAGGARVSLESTNNDVLTVPSLITIPEGQRFATFPVTSRTVLEDREYTVTASYGFGEQTAKVQLRALRVDRIELDTNSVIGGARVMGRVFLSADALDDQTVLLDSSDPAASVPSQVVIGRGKRSATFEVQTSLVGDPVDVTIEAELADKVQTVLAVGPRMLRGAVAYSDLDPFADISGPVLLRFLQPVTGDLIREETVMLDPFGRFTVSAPAQAEFGVSTKVRHWLRRTIQIGGAANSDVVLDMVNGDVNGDNSVNVADFLALRAAFGTTRGSAGYNAMADLNEDGRVGIPDFLILRANFGAQGD